MQDPNLPAERIGDLCRLAIQKKLTKELEVQFSEKADIPQEESLLLEDLQDHDAPAIWVCNGRRIDLEAGGAPISARHVHALELLEGQYDLSKSASDDESEEAQEEEAKALSQWLEIDGNESTGSLPASVYGLVAAIRSEVLSHAKHDRFTQPAKIFKRAPPAFRVKIPPAQPEGASPITVYGILDPLSTTAQSASAALALFGMAFNAEVNLVLNPPMQVEEYPLKRYYREVVRWPERLADGRLLAEVAQEANQQVGRGLAEFTLATQHTLTAAVHALPTWLVTAHEALHDMDNLRPVDVLSKGGHCQTTYALRQLYVEGQAMILGAQGWPIATAKGMQFEITGKGALEASDDTIVMGNLGYFQVRGDPGLYKASLKSGPSNETFELVTRNDLEAFREDCARIWGNLYDYSTAKYQDNHTPVLIRCPLHGIFRMRPRDHLQRRLGCPKCGSSVPGSVHDTAATLARAPSETAPRWGQHRLQSYSVAEQIAAAALRSREHTEPRWVAEIGVGTGVLTSALLKRLRSTSKSGGVVGFEIDEEILKEGFSKGGELHRHRAQCYDLTEDAKSCTRADWAAKLSDGESEGSRLRCVILKGNVLTCQIPLQCQTLVGNLPYGISSALLRHFLRQDPPLRRMVLMLQKEFAQKLLAKPGSSKFTALSALCAASCTSQVLIDRLGPELFQPPPRVDSQVLLLEPKQARGALRPSFERLCHALLPPDSRRSADLPLQSALEAVEAEGKSLELPPRWRVAFGPAGVDPAMRTSQLSVENLLALSDVLDELSGRAKTEVAASSGNVSSYITPPHQLRVKMRPGKSHDALFAEEGTKARRRARGSRIMSALQSLLGSSQADQASVVKKAADGEETVHIFSVASGHLYEKLLGIMILSVRNNTQNPLHFWFIDNFLSPKFKAFIPWLAARYDFKYDFVTYKWPSWLNPQSEKQRLIWAYKILFLDVLFPQDVPKIIFIDADQVVRADVKELWELDLKGKVYGFVPMGDSNPDTEGFRFWKQGYWKSHLQGLPYHISALFVVDLLEFRRTSTGETLRGVYNQLSRDPNSLANLDQDLPNFAQHQVPIFTLPTEWLWCETWCSQESKKLAKTIDLCQNPLTKEPKIVMAKRIISEWQTYHNEVQSLQEEHDDASTSMPPGKVEL
ncbi:unnamed protein product [Durusdinium trenchii]